MAQGWKLKYIKWNKEKMRKFQRCSHQHTLPSAQQQVRKRSNSKCKLASQSAKASSKVKGLPFFVDLSQEKSCWFLQTKFCVRFLFVHTKLHQCFICCFFTFCGLEQFIFQQLAGSERSCFLWKETVNFLIPRTKQQDYLTWFSFDPTATHSVPKYWLSSEHQTHHQK